MYSTACNYRKKYECSMLVQNNACTSKSLTLDLNVATITMFTNIVKKFRKIHGGNHNMFITCLGKSLIIWPASRLTHFNERLNFIDLTVVGIITYIARIMSPHS